MDVDIIEIPERDGAAVTRKGRKGSGKEIRRVRILSALFLRLSRKRLADDGLEETAQQRRDRPRGKRGNAEKHRAQRTRVHRP